jgi:hypothetical protein
MKVEFSNNREGRCEALISESTDWRLFNKVAKLIVKKFNGRLVEKLDGLEQRYWDIEIEGEILTLHSEHYIGISLFPQNKEANEVVKAVGEYLASVDLTP